MDAESIEILTDAIKEYFGNYELEELCGRFNIEIDHLGVNPNHQKLVTGLMADASRENHRRFLEDILSKLLRRCEDRILNTTWAVNVFDSIQLVKTPVRLLIGQSQQEIATNLDGKLIQMRKQGRDIEVRHHLKLNDRFIIFNGRCWMASCSLPEVGQVTLSLIECVDTKPVVVKEIGRKWREAKVYQ